jgi:hypothetical protein
VIHSSLESQMANTAQQALAVDAALRPQDHSHFGIQKHSNVISIEWCGATEAQAGRPLATPTEMRKRNAGVIGR